MTTDVLPFDTDELLARVAGDTDLLQELVEIYDVEFPRMLADLQTCLHEADAKGVERAAHRLRGSVGSFGAARASEAAAVLEQMGRTGALGSSEAVYLDLVDQLTRVSQAIHRYLRESPS